jgi:hypothetical protein
MLNSQYAQHFMCIFIIFDKFALFEACNEFEKVAVD